MITLSKCACGNIAHIFTEESRYNNQYTPWSARCECTGCGFYICPSIEYTTSEEAVEAISKAWNTHPIIKGKTRPYIGDTPEQLGSLLVADAVMVEGYLVTKQQVREMKADIEFLLEQTLLIEHAQNHEKQRELRAKYGIRWL